MWYLHFSSVCPTLQGWMENTAMFNGFYTDKKMQLAASNYNMPLAYFLVTVIVLLVSLIVMVHK